MASILSKALALVMPKSRGVGQGVAFTPSFRPNLPGAFQIPPSHRDHTLDIYSLRQAYRSDDLMEIMFANDPDVSAAVNAYLTVANTKPIFEIRDLNGQFVPEAYAPLHQILTKLTHEFDLTQGYQAKTSLRRTSEALRWIALCRGGCAVELVTDENLLPTELRIVDTGSLRWVENEPGNYKPLQVTRQRQIPISLDIPTFFVANHRTSPLTMYSTSPFVSAINTIATRTEVINTLYRIMTITGLPRIDVKVLETVITNSAPANVKNDALKLRVWVNDRINDIRGTFVAIRPDEALVHTDATEVSILNDKMPGLGVDITPIISVLNAQNTAALKSVATVLGRGESGTNTASVEARIFSLNADELNGPVEEVLSRALTCAMQLLGFPVIVSLKFKSSEMRPPTELEPMLAVRQGRLLTQLSLGLISDDEYCLQMLNRLPLPGQRKLSGTGFQATSTTNRPDPTPSPNADPLGRALSPGGQDAHKSKAFK